MFDINPGLVHHSIKFHCIFSSVLQLSFMVLSKYHPIKVPTIPLKFHRFSTHFTSHELKINLNKPYENPTKIPLICHIAIEISMAKCQQLPAGPQPVAALACTCRELLQQLRDPRWPQTDWNLSRDLNGFGIEKPEKSPGNHGISYSNHGLVRECIYFKGM